MENENHEKPKCRLRSPGEPISGGVEEAIAAAAQTHPVTHIEAKV